MAINGREVVILVETSTGVWHVAAGQRSATFSMETAEIDASSKDDTTEASFLPGRNSASVDLEALWVDSDLAWAKLRSARDARTLVKIRRSKDHGQHSTEEANAFITKLSESYPDNEVGTVSASLRISGGWTPVAP